MKRIIASIVAAGAVTFAIAGTASAAEPCPPAQGQGQVQRTSYESRNFREREHERFERMQARKRELARLRYERVHRFGTDRW